MVRYRTQLLCSAQCSLQSEFRASLLDRPSSAPARSPSRPIVTSCHQRAPRPYASKAWGAPRPEPLRLVPAACARCGGPVEKRRRRHCEACMPAAKREHGLRAIERARSALRAATAAGNDPRADAKVNRKRGAAIARAAQCNREWKREHRSGSDRDRSWYLREVAPKLDDLPLSAIANATGLSLAACSRYRSGARVPHPRHWLALEALTCPGPAKQQRVERKDPNRDGG
jgi:hypothetical protein